MPWTHNRNQPRIPSSITIDSSQPGNALGYRVLEARNGKVALQLLDANRVDLLFTDVVMPGGMNGRQLADEAVRRRPKLKVLFTTGYTRNAMLITGGSTLA